MIWIQDLDFRVILSVFVHYLTLVVVTVPGAGATGLSSVSGHHAG